MTPEKESRHLERKTSSQWLFVIRSQLGFAVRTTQAYWSLITAVKHPNLIGKETEVVHAIRQPDQVRRSRVDASVYLFYRKLNGKHLCVVTKRMSAKMGFIMTAYVTEKIKEGRVVWKK